MEKRGEKSVNFPYLRLRPQESRAGQIRTLSQIKCALNLHLMYIHQKSASWALIQFFFRCPLNSSQIAPFEGAGPAKIFLGWVNRKK